MAIDYESLDLFYLGKDESVDDELVLYKSAHLTTHAAILGMTGSGKTGLGIGILEEAILDNIPLLVIDPKGDMGNLALGFRDFDPKLYEPWMDADEAQSLGVSVEELARQKATLWRDGLERSHQDSSRLDRFIDNSRITIYTPGSTAGVSINILGSFAAPPAEIVEDADTLSSLLHASTMGLLSLIGERGADDGSDPSYLLLSTLFRHYWLEGEDLSMEALVGAIVKPPFKKLGLLSVETIMPQKSRLSLAMKLNGVLASPTFAAWTEGESLDIASMLYTDKAKPKVSIFYLSHLSEEQRMFFVTMLLGRLVEWMRTQSGSSRLRAMLYMDEVFGYFPPSKNTPAKESMMLLLKQARAFGVSVVLSTQNPADLDYRALSNIGTWFIGKLQTSRDREKVLQGIGGESSERSRLDRLIAKLPSRTFLLKSAREKEPTIFSTRWVLSYLKGPLSRSDIKILTPKKVIQTQEPVAKNPKQYDSRALLSLDIDERFIDSTPAKTRAHFVAYLECSVSYRFYSASRGIDMPYSYTLSLLLDDQELKWDDSAMVEPEPYQSEPKSLSEFQKLPSWFVDLKSTSSIAKSLKNHIYCTATLTTYKCVSLRLSSTVEQTQEQFSATVLDRLNERLERDLQKLQDQYAKKEQRLRVKEQRLIARLDKERSDAKSAVVQSALGFGMALFDIFSGSSRVRTKTRRAASAFKKGKRAYDERRGVEAIEEQLELLGEEFDLLEDEFAQKSAILREKNSIELNPIVPKLLKPRKSDIAINEIALVYRA